MFDWEQRKLGDVSEIKDSARIPNTEWEKAGVPYLRSSDLSNGHIDGELFLSFKNYEKYANKTGAPEKGDLLFASGGDIGIAVYKDNESPVYVQGGSILYVKTSRTNKLDGLFLQYAFESPKVKSYIKNASTGTSLKHFVLKSANSLPILFSSIEEQKKIGSFFKQLDDTIALHHRKLELLKQLKKAYLQQMFPTNGEINPKVRFANFTNVWEQRKLGELMEIASVKRIHQSDWKDSGVRFLRARDIVSAAKGEEPAEYLYISDEKYDEYSKISGKVQVGDLLVTGVGSIGVPMLIDHEAPLYFKDGNIIWFKNKNKIAGQFLYYSFISFGIQKYIRNVAGIGTVGTYTIESGKKTPISLSSFEEQQKIGIFFKQLDDTIALHQNKIETIKKIKKAFLQKMFI